ncbi:MAG: hypothetical protein HFG70_03680 [Hungatella sp.]|nr:hypothetical protein [Hungatella sp.]
MDVKEAVKDKEQYKDIVGYFQEMNPMGTDGLVLLIDTIELMSEEIFEHYKALQAVFKKAVSGIFKRREREGGFGFLTASQKCQLSYAIEKAGALKVLLWEKYEEYDRELRDGCVMAGDGH